jgi:V/A-type H+-transporting ATPase subunit I
MFYPERMKKIEILALDRYQDGIVEKLHDLGSVEIKEMQGEGGDDLRRSRRREHILSMLRKTEGMQDVLSSYEEKEAVSLKKIIFEKTPSFSFDRSLLREGAARSYLFGLERRIKRLKDRLTRIENEIEKRAAIMRVVKRFEGFQLDLSQLRDTQKTFTLAGEIPKDNLDQLLKDLSRFSVSISHKEEVETAVVILLGLKWERDRVVGSLLRNGFDRFIIPEIKGLPSDLIREYEGRIKSFYEQKEKIVKELRIIGGRERSNLLALQEFFEIERERVEVVGKFTHSARTFALEGYVPEKLVSKTLQEVLDQSQGHAVGRIKEPDEVEEKIPVMLDNPRFVRPFQILTKAYSMPKYNEVDPTFLLALWFPLFFGIMLTDLAYGAGLLMLSWFFFNSFESGGIRDLSMILLISSLWTLILGFAFGSVFGDLLERFFAIKFGLFNPLVKADFALLLAIIIGLIHLNLGLLIGFRGQLYRRNLKELIFNHLWIFLLEISAGLFILSRVFEVALLNWAAIFFLAAIVLILLAKAGIFGILELPSIISSNLSYARLLALSLATTGIAMAVNTIGGLFYGSILGTLIAFFILFGGHIFNFGINVFGAFVHSMRLHYVEFFSMFYEGGGREFLPFKAKRKYTIKGGV